MDDLISRQAAIDAIISKPAWHNSEGSWYHGSDIRQALKELPPAQPKNGVIEQIKWERDVAIEQLKKLGYGLGEKIRAEKDCISRQAAIEALLKCGDYYKGNDEAKRGVSQCVGVIYDLPSAQPKIIRCKDCKWYREGVHLSPNKFCYRLKDNSGERIGYNFADNDFCSRAERRTDGRHD